MTMPYLSIWDVTPVVVTFTNGLSDEGEPLVVGTYDGKCCFSDKSKTVRTKDGQWVQISGALTVKGDIAPTIDTLEGFVVIKNNKWKIQSSSRGRNPDGSIHHTRLELL